MAPRARYPDLLDAISSAMTSLSSFLRNLESEAVGSGDSLSITLGNYLRDASVKEKNPVIISNLGSVLTTVARKVRANDTESLSILRRTLTSFIERYVTESISGLSESCRKALEASRSILLVPPGRLSEECVRSWSHGDQAKEVYILRHTYIRAPVGAFKNVKTVEVLPSALSLIEGRVDTVVVELQGVVQSQAVAPPGSAGAISYVKRVNGGRAVGVSLGIAVMIAGRADQSILLRNLVEVPQAWGEALSAVAQDIVNLGMLDSLILGKDIVEGSPSRLYNSARRVAVSVLKELSNAILSAVVVEQNA